MHDACDVNAKKVGIRLAREIKSKKFQGVYYRELDGGDRSYFLRVRIDGKVKRIPIGRKSEGITEAFCFQEKTRILNSLRFGEDAAQQLQKVRVQDPSFIELLDWYTKKRSLKDGTIRKLEILKKVPFANSRKITRADVQGYVDHLAKTKRPETVTLHYRQIRALMRYAINREKYKYADPTVGIDLPKRTGPRKRYFTSEEITRLLDALKDEPRLYLFTKMSLSTGARMSTVLSVHRDHIEPDGTVELYNHKADRWYKGFFDAETMQLLRGKDGYVLGMPGREHEKPPCSWLQKKLQKVLNELFNTDETPKEDRAVIHTLRHSVASRMLEKGVPLEIVSKTLDHSSIAITAQVYGKISPQLIHQSVKGLWD